MYCCHQSSKAPEGKIKSLPLRGKSNITVLAGRGPPSPISLPSSPDQLLPCVYWCLFFSPPDKQELQSAAFTFFRVRVYRPPGSLPEAATQVEGHRAGARPSHGADNFLWDTRLVLSMQGLGFPLPAKTLHCAFAPVLTFHFVARFMQMQPPTPRLQEMKDNVGIDVPSILTRRKIDLHYSEFGLGERRRRTCTERRTACHARHSVCKPLCQPYTHLNP